MNSRHTMAKRVVCALFAACTVLISSSARAQAPAPSRQAPTPAAEKTPEYRAHGGRWTLGAQLGFSMEYGLDIHEVSHIQMLVAQPQIGYIVHDFHSAWVRRFEVIDEGILGSAVHPSRAYLAGDTLIFRFDGKAHGRWVPFLDSGAGVQHTPLSKHVPEVNGFTQFTPQGGFGLQYFIRPQRALVFEVRTVHMSNADLAPPNMGFNSGMLTIGFRWLPRPK